MRETERTPACPPWFNNPRPGTSMAVPQVPARATAEGAAHHTTAAPVRTITTQTRRISSPRHIPSGTITQADTLARQE
jgi:hypothetical protein